MSTLESLREETLFEKAKRDVDTFRDRNDHDSLFNAVCTLYHVRDWIKKNGKDSGRKFSKKLEMTATKYSKGCATPRSIASSPERVPRFKPRRWTPRERLERRRLAHRLAGSNATWSTVTTSASIWLPCCASTPPTSSGRADRDMGRGKAGGEKAWSIRSRLS